MAKFLLIGPSGIGKSTVVEGLSKYEDIETFDLDRIIEKQSKTDLTKYTAELGWAKFSNMSKEIIESINSEKDIVIAVGAGSIEDMTSHNWYIGQNTISLIGNPEKIYPRSNRNEYYPTLESFSTSEYSAWRRKLYESTKYKIDVSDLNKDDVVNKVLEIIQGHSVS